MTKAKLNILSFNIGLAPFIWRPYARISVFSNQREVKSADIITLQEVHTYDMFLFLRRQLNKFAHVSYKPGLIGPKAGLVTFSRYTLHTEDFMPLFAHKGILISKSNGITIVNVHLIAHTDGDWSTKSNFYLPHKVQLDNLNKQLQKGEQKIVLAGDFNLDKSSSLYEYFVAKGQWQDTAKHDNTPTFHKEFLPSGRDPKRIDYIFVRGNISAQPAVRVFEDKVNSRFLANHMGLTTRVGA